MASLRCSSVSSAARSFLAVASRSHAARSATLEFLLPRCAPATTTPRHVPRTIPVRSFSISTVRRATVCVKNPVKDENGKDMMMDITPRAAKRLSDIMKKDQNPNLALRIQVESGGCHGFQYLMSLITIPSPDAAESASTVINEDDTIFQFHPDEADADATGAERPRIILDEPSLDLLKGSKVDFTMELIGSQFKIVDNPYATSSCGCGTSFDIKM